MPSHFVTRGPFQLDCVNGELSKAAFSTFWRAEKELSQAFGVYIFAREDRKAKKLVPIYVGKSDRGFKSRLNARHSIFRKLDESQLKGQIYLFLIARSTTKGKKLKVSRKKYIIKTFGDEPRKQPVKTKSVSRLEFALIGHCLRLNSRLLNDQEKSFHKGLVVPGYLNDEDLRRDKDAVQLAKMLKVKK